MPVAYHRGCFGGGRTGMGPNRFGQNRRETFYRYVNAIMMGYVQFIWETFAVAGG